jgi:hypothetical protein
MITMSLYVIAAGMEKTGTMSPASTNPVISDITGHTPIMVDYRSATKGGGREWVNTRFLMNIH